MIAQRIVFGKIIVKPKGKQRKIKGAICNVPVNCNQTCNILPRALERCGIILIIIKFGYNARSHWLKERALCVGNRMNLLVHFVIYGHE